MRTRTRTKVLGAALLLALVAAPLAAHDLFLKLGTYFLRPDAPFRVLLLNGTFRTSENAVTRDRVSDVSLVTPAGVTHPEPEEWDDRGDTTRFQLRTGGPGTYVLGLSTRPRELTMSGSDFDQYLREEGVPDVLAARRRAGASPRDSVSERYAKHVKAVLQVGADRSGGYDAVLGYPAELVPQANPYALRVGGSLPVLCLAGGRPSPGQVVILGRQTPGGAIRTATLRADGAGVVRVPLRGPGRVFVKFIHMVPVTDGSGPDYESSWATLTFEVR